MRAGAGAPAGRVAINVAQQEPRAPFGREYGIFGVTARLKPRMLLG
jgi:hypothetical protein